MKLHGVEISLGARQEEESSNERAQDNRWEEQHSFSFVEATIEVGMGILMSRWSDGRALEELLCPHSDNHRFRAPRRAPLRKEVSRVLMSIQERRSIKGCEGMVNSAL